MDEMFLKVIEIDKICRLCLNDNRALIDIFEPQLCTNSLPLYQKIVSCTSIDILENDGLPTRICSECLANLNTAFNFRIQCENANKTLQEFKSLLSKVNKNCKDEASSNDVDFSKKNLQTDKICNKESDHFIVIKNHEKVSNLEECADNIFLVVNEEKFEQNKNYSNSENLHYIVEKISEPVPGTECSEKGFPELITGACKESDTPDLGKGPCNISINVSTKKEEVKLGKLKEKDVRDVRKTPCPYCNKMLTRVEEHVRLLHRNKVYICSKKGCGAEFLTLKNLQSHQLNCFDVEKAYKCSKCFKEFHRKSNYKAHFRRHSNKKEFQCQLCDKAFVDTTGLKRHFLKHHEPEQELFVSVCCGKKFKSKEGLKKHICKSICGVQIFHVVEPD